MFEADARRALQEWADVSGLTFVEVAAGKGDITFSSLDFLGLWLSGTIYNSYTASYSPTRSLSETSASETQMGGDIFVHRGVRDTIFFSAVLKSIGHAIGLKHPSGGDPFWLPDMATSSNSVMVPVRFFDQTSLGQFDPQAVQYLYGPNEVVSSTSGGLLFFDLDEPAFAVTQRWGSADSMISGTSLHDQINAGSGDDVLAGYRGNDVLAGAIGADTVFGGAGFDTLKGGIGTDHLLGENGDDKLFGQREADVLSGGNGNDTLKGGGGNDVLLGEAGDDFLKGGTRRDSLEGGAGHDRLVGNSFDDTLRGVDGADTLLAGGDNDVLDGGSGRDMLLGGAGQDIFVFAKGDGRDTIGDFDALDAGEKIDLSAIDRYQEFSDIERRMEQVGDDVLIALDRSNSVLLQNTDLADLDASDFIF
ncbi:MAG: hypothetical protein N4A53_01890 [Pelagimonas sp.]|nr:hypothetical protein [Pelagimonas sp.]